MNQARNSREREGERNARERRGEREMRIVEEGRESTRFRLSRLFSSLLRRKPWLFLTLLLLAPSRRFLHTFACTDRFVRSA